MSTITFTLSAANLTRILDAYDTVYEGRITQDEEGNDVVNATKANWAKQRLIHNIKSVVKHAEADPAGEAAKQVLVDEIETIEIT